MNNHGHVAYINKFEAAEFHSAIMKPSINLALYESKQCDLSGLLNPFLDQIDDKYQFWAKGQTLEKIKASLPLEISRIGALPSDLQQILIKHVFELVKMFSTVTGEDNPYVSLRSIVPSYFDGNETSVSSCYHRDAAFVTLFQTFIGNGTEWTPNSNVRREKWAESSMQEGSEPDSLFVFDTAKVNRTSNAVIGILKGESDPSNMDSRSMEFVQSFVSKDFLQKYNVGNGLIHRGPRTMLGEKRLLITVSTFRPPR